jgi:hypothetical protein
MVSDQAGSNGLWDTGDCLDAVGVFKGWKNFLFFTLVVCLLLLQASFYLVDRDYIKISGQAYGKEPAAEARITESDRRASTVTREKDSIPEEFFSKMTFGQLAWTINFVNAVLILTAVLYCLTLLFSLEFFVYGRLGGINHIAKAFSLSLLMLFLLLPWQKVFGSVVIGAVFTPDEMMKWYSSKTEDIRTIALYHLRFSGYGILMLMLLILSQLSSRRWAWWTKAKSRSSLRSNARNLSRSVCEIPAKKDTSRIVYHIDVCEHCERTYKHSEMRPAEVGMIRDSRRYLPGNTAQSPTLALASTASGDVNKIKGSGPTIAYVAACFGMLIAAYVTGLAIRGGRFTGVLPQAKVVANSKDTAPETTAESEYISFWEEELEWSDERTQGKREAFAKVSEEEMPEAMRESRSPITHITQFSQITELSEEDKMKFRKKFYEYNQ